MKKVFNGILKVLGVIMLMAIIAAIVNPSSNEDNTKEDGSKASNVVEEQKNADEAIEDTKDVSDENSETTGDASNTETKEAPSSEENAIEIGKELDFNKFSVEVTEYKIIPAYKNKKALKITYKFTNKSDDVLQPYLQANFRGFQDDVETDSVYAADDINFSVKSKDVKPGASLENCQTAVGIDDMSKPLTLEVSKLISFGNVTYSVTLDLSQIK